METNDEEKLGAFSTVSIGIGGMVGGGIFAVTGLTIEVTYRLITGREINLVRADR